VVTHNRIVQNFAQPRCSAHISADEESRVVLPLRRCCFLDVREKGVYDSFICNAAAWNVVDKSNCLFSCRYQRRSHNIQANVSHLGHDGANENLVFLVIVVWAAQGRVELDQADDESRAPVAENVDAVGQLLDRVKMDSHVWQVSIEEERGGLGVDGSVDREPTRTILEHRLGGNREATFMASRPGTGVRKQHFAVHHVSDLTGQV
jgi:hypothetical protein